MSFLQWQRWHLSLVGFGSSWFCFASWLGSLETVHRPCWSFTISTWCWHWFGTAKPPFSQLFIYLKTNSSRAFWAWRMCLFLLFSSYFSFLMLSFLTTDWLVIRNTFPYQRSSLTEHFLACLSSSWVCCSRQASSSHWAWTLLRISMLPASQRC